MKHYHTYTVLVVLALGAAAIFVGCASAPASAAPAAPSTPPVPETAAPSPLPKEKAVEARGKALSVKADTAARDDYQAADLVFAAAEAMDAGGLDAGNQYQEAELLFTVAYDSAKSKRDEAQRQLDTARTAIKDVEIRAAESDREQQGGNQ
ncbi:hypothetical protein FACS189468_3360 [Spirochaetia bacterium]|nr:hypothetical protein FACS189468_3360 [Spirochaetia bacterium]